MNKWIVAAAGALSLALCVNVVAPAQAMTKKECSAKYKAAKKAGTLKGMKWKAFRQAQCGSGAPAAPLAANPMKSHSKRVAATSPSASGAVFPNAVSPKYSKQSAGRARMHTCLDQYHANKATNSNGGLKWIQKGGGYYSECVKHLKAL